MLPSPPNDILGALLTAHGCTVTEHQGWLVVDNKPPILSAAFFPKPPSSNGFIGQLDVQVVLENERLVESFAGVGADESGAVRHAWSNFAAGSLHVLLSAFFGKTNNHVTLETWGNQKWQATIGNFGVNTFSSEAIDIPENLFETLRTLILALPLPEDCHWFRMYFARAGSGHITSEVLHNNNIWQEAATTIAALSWQHTDTFYSVRLFLLIQRNTD